MKEASPSDPNLKPLWEGPVHFHLRSAEATLVLSSGPPLTGQEIANIVTGQSTAPEQTETQV